MTIPFRSILITATLIGGLIGCGVSPTTPESIQGPKLFVSQSDFQSGLLEWISTRSHAISSSNLSIHNDATLRTHGGYLYILEMHGMDNIVKFDPSKSDQSGVLYQKHLGDNWNPVDIEFLSETKAYISNQNQPKITIFNPSAGEIVGHIDISAYTYLPDSNTTPYAGDLQLVDSDLYVILQRRNGVSPGAPTLLLRIDTNTDLIADTVALQFKNGYAMSYHDGALYVSNPGSAYATGDGGIEKVDLTTKAVSTIITEETLGGSPNNIVHKEGTRFYVTSYVGWQNVPVIELDVATEKVVGTLSGVKDAYGGIHYDAADSTLYVGERHASLMGVRIFRNGQELGSPLKSANSLPPTSMVIVR